jgi:hypothetical protein
MPLKTYRLKINTERIINEEDFLSYCKFLKKNKIPIDFQELLQKKKLVFTSLGKKEIATTTWRIEEIKT